MVDRQPNPSPKAERTARPEATVPPGVGGRPEAAGLGSGPGARAAPRAVCAGGTVQGRTCQLARPDGDRALQGSDDHLAPAGVSEQHLLWPLQRRPCC